MTTAVIIPAYNEAATIRDVITAFHAELPDAEIVVVDNNSSDNTQQIARNALTAVGGGDVLFEKRQGKAHAVKKAFLEVNADYYVLVDADMTYSAGDVHALLRPVIERGVDMVVGDRHAHGRYKHQNKRIFHNFGNHLVRRLIRLLFQGGLKDILSGYRAFNRKFVKNFPILSSDFAIETELTLHALDKNFSVEEVPVSYRDRPAGSVSKLNTYVDGLKIIRLILSIFKDYRPLSFFSAISFIFFMLGAVIGVPVIVEFIDHQYIYKVPSAILASGLMIFSIIFFSIGVTLDTVVSKQRFMYHLHLLHYQETESRSEETARNS
ncbi:MAG TPA: glycosyltransferase [Desulfobacteraceae bacterium]|nr:glycosyltransferase [Desulfobacteraceae bacterium]